VLPPATQKPDARSSFTFHPHEKGAVIFGGYSRIKSTVAAGKQLKGGGQGLRTVLKPTIYQDTWFLRISPPGPDAPSNNTPTIRWERRKKPTNPPNPPRAGSTMAYHKGRGIMFGGVHDVEESEEGIESEFFDTLFAWNIERNRYFQLTLRRPKVALMKQADDRGNLKRGRGKADEAELLRNLAALETKGLVADTSGVPAQDMDLDETPAKPVKPVLFTMPHPRFNAQLAVQDDMLYIFGGTYEQGDREFTFDEMWAIDLGKLDGVHEIYRRELDNWQGSDEEDSDTQSNDEDDSEDEDADGDSSMGVPLPPQETGLPLKVKETVVPLETADSELEQPEPVVADTRPHPRPFESLREFFTRTSVAWQDVVIESLRNNDATFQESIKELRKRAFDLAEEQWWDCREEIIALEDEQEEAGIGEVISMDNRNSEAGGVGRRR
jgi:hypothetical protein